MIENSTQLEIAMKQLESFQQMLEAMRLHLLDSNPELFPTLSEGYLKRIETLQDDIFSYLRERPAEAPLKVRISGPIVKAGVIKANIASTIIGGLQSAMYQIGGVGQSRTTSSQESPEVKGLKARLGLNLVATASGSFILSMDLAPRQLHLFEEYDITAGVLERLIGHVNELQEDPSAYSGNRLTLKALKKVTSVIKGGIETVEVSYHDETHDIEAVFNPTIKQRIESLLGVPNENERTLRGTLLEINTRNNTCEVHPENESRVVCDYEEEIEDDLITFLRKEIEIAGQFIPLDWPVGAYRITRIERVRLIDNENDAE